MQEGEQFVCILFHELGGFGKINVMGGHVGLHQQAVVHLQAGVESGHARRGKEYIVFLHPNGGGIVDDESAQTRNNDAIIAHQ